MARFGLILVASLLCGALPGCGSGHLATAGVATMGVGAFTTSVGLSVATGIDFETKDDPTTPGNEGEDTQEAHPKEGVIAMAVGMTLIVVGGVLVGLVAPVKPQPTPCPEPPLAGTWRLKRKSE